MTSRESSSLPTRASKSLCAHAASCPLHPSAINRAPVIPAILHTLPTLTGLLTFCRIRISSASARILAIFSVGRFWLGRTDDETSPYAQVDGIGVVGVRSG